MYRIFKMSRQCSRESNVTDNLQAFGSVVLVVRAAAEHEKI